MCDLLVKILDICINLSKNGSSHSVCTIEDPFIVVHPNLSKSDQVAGDYKRGAGVGVGAFAENVPYDRTRNNL